MDAKEMARIESFYDDLARMVRKSEALSGYVGYEEDGGPSDAEMQKWLSMGINALRVRVALGEH